MRSEGYCSCPVCMYVCMYVCMCVCVSTHTCHLTHWNHKREIARVTVVVLCVCMYVCMCVCVYVCPLIPATSHIGITKERYQWILRNTGNVLNFADFPKNASFKSYGVIYLPRAAPAS